MNIRSLKEANEVLATFVPGPRAQGAYSLERMQQLMMALGDPQNEVKVIHVAGTSGKTSTAYYVAAFLQAAGKQVGLTVSPHVDNVNERLQINLHPLPEKTFCKELSSFLKLIDESGIRPTYFELLVAMAYWEFAKQKVDYAVIEVGLGGLLDGTNVVIRADKVCVITDIGLDHTEVLGQTLPEIAAQKAGIIHPNNPVFSYQQGDEVMEVLREVSSAQQAELHEVMPLPSAQLPAELPLFQRRNWYLAGQVYQFISRRDGLAALNEEQLTTTTKITIPARMEAVNFKGKTIIMDGAHNAQKLEALVTSLRQRFPKTRVAVLASFVSTKQRRLKQSLAALLPITSHLIITTFGADQDEAGKVPIEPTKVVERCEELGFEAWQIEANPKKAFQLLLKRPEPVLLITGSFYVMNHIRPLIFKRKQK